MSNPTGRMSKFITGIGGFEYKHCDWCPKKATFSMRWPGAIGTANGVKKDWVHACDDHRHITEPTQQALDKMADEIAKYVEERIIRELLEEAQSRAGLSTVARRFRRDRERR